MATTCKLIAKNVLGSDTASVTFSDIPGTHADLVVEVSLRTSHNDTQDYLNFWFNSSTANRSTRVLYAVPNQAYSTTGTAFYIPCNGNTAVANAFGTGTIYIPNYAGSTNKSLSITGMSEDNATSVVIYASAGLWSNTAAITSITFDQLLGANFKSGSSFFLYGITKA